MENPRPEALIEQRKVQLTERLVAAVQELHEDQVAEVLDFASYLRTKYEYIGPADGSAKILLTMLDSGGALQFDPGELDTILAEINQARDNDRDAVTYPLVSFATNSSANSTE